MLNPIARAAVAEMKRLAAAGVEPHKLPWTQAVRALSSVDLEISTSIDVLSLLADRPVIVGQKALKGKCLEAIADAPKKDTWKFLPVLVESDFREDAALEEHAMEIFREISEDFVFPKTNVAYVVAALILRLKREPPTFQLPDLNVEISRSMDMNSRAKCVWGLGRISSMGYSSGVENEAVRRNLDASELAPVNKGCSRFMPPQRLLPLIQLHVGLGALGLDQSQAFKNVRESVDCAFEQHNQDVIQVAEALWWLCKIGESNPFPDMYAICVNRTDTMSRSDRAKILTCLKYTNKDSPLLSYIEKNDVISRKNRSQVNWRRERT